MTKKDNEHFRKAGECWIFGKPHVDSDVKIKDVCHITVK